MRPAIEQMTSEQGFAADDGIVEHYRIAPMTRDAGAILAVSPDVSSFEQIGDECHYRFDYADGQFIGHGEVCSLFDGAFIEIMGGENRTPRLYSEHDGWTRTLFIRSKATELFCHVLKALELDEGFGAPEASLATSRGVLRAQQILAERFAAPPSLDDLARDVGLSRSSLCAGFRQILGQPVFSYIQDRRMERTLTLLNETQLTISEIAHAVGYSHLSSFTAAVQRRFGMSPSELRRTAL